ncbi:MAG: HD domain-containing protein [Lachnospiraceae bacterium]|nr:HD domain-containing protein [Lachnospiraceae bacterium]MBQ7781162.1 HD domain-containing protein [Lachnospiraceae bacterium]
MKLLFGTGNQAKLSVMKSRLEKLGIELIGLSDLKAEGKCIPEVLENGNTPLENARLKALAYYEAFQIPVFSCDSGLYFDNVPDEIQPGVHVRNVNGKCLSDEEMLAYYTGLARQYGNLIARYRNAICFVMDEKNIFESMDLSMASEKFILTDKPHSAIRKKGFPLDSMSIDIKTNRYYYDLSAEELEQFAVEDGVLQFFEKVLNFKLVIENARKYVKQIFADDCSGHDYHHTMRVYRLAMQIAEKENADMLIVQLAALLHDVDDIKLSPQTHKTKKNAVDFMRSNGLEDKIIASVCSIIDAVSFAGKDSVVPGTIEGKCVQDADRLDAMGAIGIARTFAYGTRKGRKIYDPDIRPLLNMNKEAYRQNQNSTSINHFYEKLLLLKEMMNTETARKMAEHRHVVMEAYLEEFVAEWEGER